MVLDIAWAVAMVVLVQAACLRARPAGTAPPRRYGGVALVSAAGVAVLVLALPRALTIGWWVELPAILTLAAAGARLLIALREANAMAETYRLSRTDDLTRLPNRRSVLVTIDEVADGSPLAMLLLDVDAFKDVNDTVGHAIGDTVLQLVGTRLREAVPVHLAVARLGGDEFALLLRQGDPALLLLTAHRIRAALSEPVRVGGLEIVLSVPASSSCGISRRSTRPVGGSSGSRPWCGGTTRQTAPWPLPPSFPRRAGPASCRRCPRSSCVSWSPMPPDGPGWATGGGCR